jgi:hypothetical protein
MRVAVRRRINYGSVDSVGDRPDGSTGTMRLEVKAFADAPRDVVYRTLTDIAARPKFVSAVECVDLLSRGPIGIGTRFVEGRTVLGRGVAIEFTVGDYDPPGIFVLSAELAGVGFEVSCTLGYTGHETSITLELVGTPETLGGRFTAFSLSVLGDRLRAEFNTELGDIAREAERRFAARRPVVR